MPRTSRFVRDTENIGTFPRVYGSPFAKSRTVVKSSFHGSVILVRKRSAVNDDGCDSRKEITILGIVLLGCVVGQTESIEGLSVLDRINDKIWQTT